jgi:cytochrome c553
VPACATCHGPDGAGSNALPRLAGQHAAYLDNQLRQFGKRERNNDNAVMHAVVEKMTPLEMAAVAEYLSGR